jgi:hypothetical protein
LESDSKWIVFKIKTSEQEPKTGGCFFLYNVKTDEIVQLSKNYDDGSMRWSPVAVKHCSTTLVTMVEIIN